MLFSCFLFLQLMYGCIAEESYIRKDTHNTHWWIVHVWTQQDKDKPKDTKIYSIRQGNERHKALADCDKWMKSKDKEYERKTK